MNKRTNILAAISALLMTPVLGDVTPNLVSPWDVTDGQWITISGKITEAGANTFKLDYGKGAVTVEMDDYDPKLEGFNLIKNDRVIVTGRVDADATHKRTIEAASVYVKNIKKSFFASPDDEEEVIQKLRKATREGAGVVVTGKVTLVAAKMMTIDTGYQAYDVSTAVLPENAFDKTGNFQLEEGDTVTVYGAITDGFIDEGKIVATNLAEH